MQNFIDNLIFPAPRSEYTFESMRGKLIYIPKFKECFNNNYGDMADCDQIWENKWTKPRMVKSVTPLISAPPDEVPDSPAVFK